MWQAYQAAALSAQVKNDAISSTFQLASHFIFFITFFMNEVSIQRTRHLVLC